MRVAPRERALRSPGRPAQMNGQFAGLGHVATTIIAGRPAHIDGSFAALRRWEGNKRAEHPIG